MDSYDEVNERTFGFSPSYISQTVISIIENYGWYLLLFAVLFTYIYQKLFKSYVDSYLKRKSEEEYIAKYHKNPDLFMTRQAAQQEYALKLQEKYKREAEVHQRKMEEKEAKKREEYIQKYDLKEGRKLGPDEDKTKSFKPDYNPLMGGGSSSNYRPPRRSACSRGGCG